MHTDSFALRNILCGDECMDIFQLIVVYKLLTFASKDSLRCDDPPTIGCDYQFQLKICVSMNIRLRSDSENFTVRCVFADEFSYGKFIAVLNAQIYQ